MLRQPVLPARDDPRAPIPLAAVVVAALALTGCEPGSNGATPMALEEGEVSRPATTVAGSASPFTTWHQGFNHGTAGWFGNETAGPLGWCGMITPRDRGEDGSLRPSAGRGYATVSGGACNGFWDAIFSPPGATLVNAPWAPGPDFALLSDTWPAAGFVMQLDIYLDPGWKPGTPEPGTLNFFAPPGTIFTYVASLRELDSSDDAFGSFHYFGVPVFADDGGLSILGHRIADAGWYTFRHRLGDDDGRLTVDFELADRRGGVVFTEPAPTRFFTGLPTSELVPAGLGSGYLWFASVTPGLELPIDEHRVEPRR